MRVPVGRKTTSLRRRDGTKVRETEEDVDCPTDSLAKLRGDGLAGVDKTVALGISREVADGLWLKGEVSTTIRLTCNQSQDGVEAADRAAWDLAMDKSLDGLDELQNWSDALATSLGKRRR